MLTPIHDGNGRVNMYNDRGNKQHSVGEGNHGQVVGVQQRLDGNVVVSSVTNGSTQHLIYNQRGNLVGSVTK